MRGLNLAALRFDDRGLVPVIAATPGGRVLMLAWADREALERSLATGEMHYHSRSRDKLWRKGETSGNFQRLLSLHADCDADAVLAIVEQQGPACHTGAPTCFHDPDENAGEAGPGSDQQGSAGGADWAVLGELLSVIRSRRGSGSYTAKLLADENRRQKKVAEEAGEYIRAAAKGEKTQVAQEAADLLYHLMVSVEGDGVPFEQVLDVLRERRSKA